MLTPRLTTGIGSLPHRKAAEACSLVLGTFDIPFWPQLPNRSFRELMIPQYSEGMPFLKIDEDRQVVWVERDGSDELDRFYEGWTEESRIAISEDFASGLRAFLDVVKGKRFPVLKGHVTGPLTFTLGLKDGQGRPVFFDEELREISLMLLKAKSLWQIDILRQHADGVIIFVDEPILSALGSPGYMGVSGEEALRLLSEITGAIRGAGALSGIHCCGNSDWSMVVGSGADIVSFDAFDYLNTISLYAEDFTGFLRRGGFLAWGIVPTSEAIGSETPESVRRRFDAGMESLSTRLPSDLLTSNMLLTPSCGTGSRSVEETLKIFQILMRLKEDLG